MDEYWLKQRDKPLFEDVLWSKPENKKAAGKLLVVGGHVHALHAPIKAFEIAKAAGIGKVTVVMPDAVPDAITNQKHVEPVASSKSGGIASSAIDKIYAEVEATDVVLWPGSLGRDSETTQLIEHLLDQSKVHTVLADDSADSLIKLTKISSREDTCLVLTMAQLRSLNTSLKSNVAITHDMQLSNLTKHLADLTSMFKFSIITLHANQIIVAFEGKVSSTPLVHEVDKEEFRWRLAMSTLASVLWAQFPNQLFQGLTTAAWIFKKDYSGEK